MLIISKDDYALTLTIYRRCMHHPAMTLNADIFWSFRSPYSYLAMRRYRDLSRNYDLQLNLRPVYPLAVREPNFFERNHPNWLRYTFLDAFRLSQYLGVPLAPPRPDPIVQDVATRRISDEQPYIFRLVRLGQAAARRGKGLEFADEVSALIWGGTENWHEGSHLGDAARHRLQLPGYLGGRIFVHRRPERMVGVDQPLRRVGDDNFPFNNWRTICHVISKGGANTKVRLEHAAGPWFAEESTPRYFVSLSSGILGSWSVCSSCLHGWCLCLGKGQARGAHDKVSFIVRVMTIRLPTEVWTISSL